MRYRWVAPGGFVLSGCGEPAGDHVAFCCSADDTIYVGQRFAADLHQGLAEGLPGESAGYGRATGDFAVADFDVGNAQHHGTPLERRDALLAGFNSGEPSSCRRYA